MIGINEDGVGWLVWCSNFSPLCVSSPLIGLLLRANVLTQTPLLSLSHALFLHLFSIMAPKKQTAKKVRVFVPPLFVQLFVEELQKGKNLNRAEFKKACADAGSTFIDESDALVLQEARGEDLDPDSPTAWEDYQIYREELKADHEHSDCGCGDHDEDDDELDHKKNATKSAASKKATKPTAKKPTTKKPAINKPSTKQSVQPSKTATKPAADNKAKKPAAKPAAKKPAAKPAAKKPAAKKPAAKKPAAKKPAAKKPAAKKPAAKKPAAKR